MISKTIHFIYGLDKDFGNIPFSIFHYIAVKSARIVNHPVDVMFHFKYLPKGIWWNRLVEENLAEPVKLSFPKKIYGNPLNAYFHQTEVAKLFLLFEYGGIFLDLDTICKNPFDSLLKHEFVIGQNPEKNTCGSTILAEKECKFLAIWINSFFLFRSNGADAFNMEFSRIVPRIIANIYPELVQLEPPESFCNFTSNEADLKKLFDEIVPTPNSFVIHLFESKSYPGYLSTLSYEEINRKDTTYNLIARKFL